MTKAVTELESTPDLPLFVPPSPRLLLLTASISPRCSAVKCTALRAVFEEQP